MEWWCVMQGEGIDMAILHHISPLASTLASASWRSFLKRPKTAQGWNSRDIALILFGNCYPLDYPGNFMKLPGFWRHQGFPVAVEMVRHVCSDLSTILLSEKTGRLFGLANWSCKGHLSVMRTRIWLITLGNRYRRVERLDPTEGPQSPSCILCLYIIYCIFINGIFFCTVCILLNVSVCIVFKWCFYLVFLFFQAQLQRALGGQIRETDWGHQSVDVCHWCHFLSTQNLPYPTEICDEDA